MWTTRGAAPRAPFERPVAAAHAEPVPSRGSRRGVAAGPADGVRSGAGRGRRGGVARARGSSQVATALDLAADPAELTAALVDIPRLGRRAGARRRRRGGAAASCRSWRSCAAATPCWPAPTSAGTPGCCSPATSTPCRSPTTCRAAATATPCTAAAPRDMKAGDAVFAAPRRHRRRAARTTSRSCSTTARRSRPRATGSAASSASCPTGSTADLALLGEPTDGLVEAGLPGHAAGRGPRHRPARALGPVVAGRQRDPPGGRGARPARRLRGPARGDRRLRVPRGPAGREDHRRRGGQRRARRVRRHRQLPVRAGPHRRRCRRSTSARCSPGWT